MAMIYLASPYTHDSADIMLARFEYVTMIAALLTARGELVYSPITHCHPIAQAGGIAIDWETWRDHDLAMLARCDELWVSPLDYSASKGVQCEIAEAKRLGLDVFLMSDEDIEEIQ